MPLSMCVQVRRHKGVSPFGETQAQPADPAPIGTDLHFYFFHLFELLEQPPKSVKPCSMQTFSKSFSGTLDKISSISFSSVTFFCCFLGAGADLGGGRDRVWTQQLPLKTEGAPPNLEIPSTLHGFLEQGPLNQSLVETPSRSSSLEDGGQYPGQRSLSISPLFQHLFEIHFFLT